MSRIRSILAIGACLALVGAGPCDSSSNDQGGGAAPRITSFTATPPLVAPGGASVLAWSASDVGTASLAPGIGEVTGTSYTVAPETTTIFTLTVSNAYGSDTAQATVVVQAPPCTEGLACTPAQVCHRGRTECEGSLGVCVDTGELVVDGASCGAGLVCKVGACVMPCAEGVSCTPSDCLTGATSCATPVSEPVCAPTGNAPDGIPCGTGNVCSGGSCVAPVCTVGEPCQPANPCRAGTMSCLSPTVPGTCVASAARADGTPCGTGLACVSGACIGAPTIRGFTATPDNIGPGKTATLAWDVVDATTLVIDPGVGVVTGTSTAVAPTVTTTYTLAASNPAGSAQRAVTVTYSTIVSMTMPGPFTIETGASVVLTPGVVVTGEPSLEMTWTLEPGALGTLNPARGVSTIYTAPSTSGTYRVLATSVWDPTRSGDAVVRVTEPPPPDSWRPRASMSNPRSRHTATLLASGKVLVAGGYDLPSAEIYDPATDSWRSTSPMKVARQAHAAALLASGRVLVVGGGYPEGSTAEIYDPVTDTWTSTPPMKSMHHSPTATVLPSGDVLVVGGWNDPGFPPVGPVPGMAELFHPESGEFTETDPIPLAREWLSATALPSGKVLVAGGHSVERVLTGSTMIFDETAPGGSRWTETGSMNTPREEHRATLLQSGNVLVSGGVVPDFWFPTASVEIYEVPHAVWADNGRMSIPRAGHTATLLPSGKVLFAGGSCHPECEISGAGSAETFEPFTGSWVVVKPMWNARWYHTATLLPSGRVLVVGGAIAGGGESSSRTVEEYTP